MHFWGQIYDDIMGQIHDDINMKCIKSTKHQHFSGQTYEDITVCYCTDYVCANCHYILEDINSTHINSYYSSTQ